MSITSIEWTKWPGTIGETWNPTTGCSKVDRGCKYCYAEIMHRRLQAMGQAKYSQDFLKGAVVHQDTLDIPLKWKSPRTVFVDSMSDLFHLHVPLEFIMQVFTVIKQTPQHTYLVLTKRPERAVEFWRCMWNINPNWKPPKNLVMGTSANDQESADKRVPYLLDLIGCKKFLSYEPATAAINLRAIKYSDQVVLDVLTGEVRKGEAKWKSEDRVLHWVIAGGESGPKADPSNPDWFRIVRDACQASSVPFFFKQWGLWHPESLVTREPGKKYNVRRWPTDDNYTREPMIKMNDKSFSLLDGQSWHQFPNIKTVA